MTDGAASMGAERSGSARRRAPRLLLIAGSFVLALGAVTGGVVAFLVVDKATSVDRSTPQVVTAQFLNTALKLRDGDRLPLFLCNSWSVTAALAATAPPTDRQVTVSWGDTSTQITGKSALTNVTVQFISLRPRARHSETWTLELRDEDGWRVCGLSRVQLLQP